MKIDQILNYIKELMYNEVDLGSVVCCLGPCRNEQEN